MSAVLKSVSSNLPDPPYPSETHVHGFDFRINHERLFASDTWALAPPDMRPWLLMLWVQAWAQRPAGSFTNDHDIIAARIGMDRRQFAAHADILLRGFRLHSDGRLYHRVVVEQVQKALDWRESERVRKAEYRARKREEEEKCPTGQTRDGRVSPMGVRTPEPEPEPEPEPIEELTTLTCGSPQTASDEPERTQNCPHQKILEIYHETLPMLPRMRTWDGNRPRLLSGRWREDKERQSLDWWRGFFEYISESAFLTGKVNGKNGGPPFQADLEWIVRPQNFQKINDGRYHR